MTTDCSPIGKFSFRFMLGLLLLLGASALAQVQGLQVGEVSVRSDHCSQNVVDSVNGATLMLVRDVDRERFQVILGRNYRTAAAYPFGTRPYPDDAAVILQIGEEVRSFVPMVVRRDNNLEQAALVSDEAPYWLLSAPTAVEVTFAGPIGSVLFTIRHEVIVALAAGFGQSCFGTPS